MNTKEEFNFIFDKVSYFGKRYKSKRKNVEAITSELIVNDILIFTLECGIKKEIHFRVEDKSEKVKRLPSLIRIMWDEQCIISPMLIKFPEEYEAILEELNKYQKIMIIKK